MEDGDHKELEAEEKRVKVEEEGGAAGDDAAASTAAGGAVPPSSASPPVPIAQQQEQQRTESAAVSFAEQAVAGELQNAATMASSPLHAEEEAAARALRASIQRWIRDNPHVQVELMYISDFLMEFQIGELSIPFQVGTDERWRPMFMTSSSDLLSSYLTPINVWLEDQAKDPNFDICNLLTFLGAQFHEARQNFLHGTSSVETANKLEAELRRQLAQVERKEAEQKNAAKGADGDEAEKEGGGNGGDGNGGGGGADGDEAEKGSEAKGEEDETAKEAKARLSALLASLPQRNNGGGSAAGDGAAPEPREQVKPTESDFADEIVPAVRRFLFSENFKAYEVEEWIRRITREVQSGDLDKALHTIQTEVLGGSPPPAEILRFFPERPSFARFATRNLSKRRRYKSQGLSTECVDRLLTELEVIENGNTKDTCGFSAHPSGNMLQHWELIIHGESIELGSPIGMQLVEWTLNHSSDTINDNSSYIKPADIRLEMKFPSSFPKRPPLFRIIAPRFKNVHQLNMSLTSSVDDPRTELTMSRNLEGASVWQEDMSIADMVRGIREILAAAEVDISAGKDASLATVGGFWRSFRCVTPLQFGKKELETGGQIILPPSSLEQLFNQDDVPWRRGFGAAQGPMTFEVSTERGQRSFCGVVEFTGQEGTVVMPEWIMSNLRIAAGQEVEVRRVHVPKGIYMKLQPHDNRFMEVADTKAMLEWVLRRYTAVAVGDTLVVDYRGNKYAFDILDVKPGRAIRIIDSDVAVDFAPALSGGEAVHAGMMSHAEQAGDATQLMRPGGGVKVVDGKNNSNAAATPATAGAAGKPDATTGGSSAGVSLGSAASTPDGEEGKDWKRCDNCKRGIPIATYDRHTLTCARFTWYCELCEVPIERRKQQEHIESVHGSVFCECGEEMEARLLPQHKVTQCALRKVACKFCKLDMPYRELWSHEKECGAKTEACDKCGRFVRRSDAVSHAETCGTGASSSASASDASNPYGVPQSSAYGWANPTPPTPAIRDYMPCPVCSQPFQQLDELQVHMLIQHPDNMEGAGGEPNASETNDKSGGGDDEKTKENAAQEAGEEAKPFEFAFPEGSELAATPSGGVAFKFDPSAFSEAATGDVAADGEEEKGDEEKPQAESETDLGEK